MNFTKLMLINTFNIIVLSLTFSTPVVAQRKNLIFQSTFESKADIASWYEQSLFQPWSATIVTDKVRSGKSAIKFDLVRGKDLLNGPRAELGMKAQGNGEFWYGFSNYFPGTYASDPATEIIAQWQAMPDLSRGENWRSPPLGLEIKSDRYKLAIRWASAVVNDASNTAIDYLDLGPVTHNQWNDWVFHIKWGYNSGVIQVWLNGKIIIERIGKPIGYNDLLYPYLKLGIYKWEWNNTKTISTSKERSYYLDDVRVGNNLAKYEDVAPGDVKVLPIEPNTLKVIKNKDDSYTATFTASQTVPSSAFILYIGSDSAGNFRPLVSETKVQLEKNKKYSLLFKLK
ncbi:polysaccharide lyase [Mucilaginibacter lutimaris]|uniref:Polysaccharide lyase n=1 Tax=Mucilaginibacter lutimaris TaxID=931629 RepID=A0ABW2ZKS4_9SPHI